jgi:membrane-associated phospholipid phosphatase
MNKKIFAEVVSLVFNPVIFLFALPFMVVYKQTTNFSSAIKWEMFSGFFVVIGLLIIYLGIRRGIFSDEDLSKRKEREEFYYFALVLSFAYLIAALFLKGIFFHLSIVGLGLFLAIIIFTLINRFIKASIHLAALWAFTVAVSLLYGLNYFWFTVWIIPLVAWSRLYLKRHTKKELLVGSMLGILITLATFLMAVKILEYGAYV